MGDGRRQWARAGRATVAAQVAAAQPERGGPSTCGATSVVFLSAVEFDHCLSGRTRRLAEAFATRGVSVTFVEMYGRRPSVSFAPCLAGTAGGAIRIVRLPLMPRFHRVAENWIGRAWAAQLACVLRRLVPRLPESWVIVSNPLWVAVLRHLPSARLCYDCIDHVRVHALAGSEARYESWERELIAMSDAVSVVHPRLASRVRALGGERPIALIPNAVPSAWLASDAATDPSPTERREMPVAGFLGAIFEWVDLALLEHAARALPRFRFVLVGPSRWGVRCGALERLDNVRRFGAQPFAHVPRWLRTFDVGLIPFARGGVAEFADPIKLYEYSALGLPVVSTMEPACRDGLPLYIADTPRCYAEAIVQAAADDIPQAREERVRFARRHTWERRAEALEAVLST